MILLDTNVLSELMRPAPEPVVAGWVGGQPSTSLFISSVTEAELRLGVALLRDGKRRDRLTEAIEGMLTQDFVGRILPFDSAAASAYARIAADRRAAGRPISQFDAQIASIARSRNDYAAQNSGAYAAPGPALGGGTVPGVVGGAAVGAAVGGPVGAVVGGVVGGTAGTALIPGPVHDYVLSESVPSVPYEGRIAIGERWPGGIELHAVPSDRRFGYAMVNNQRVVVNRHSHRIVEVD